MQFEIGEFRDGSIVLHCGPGGMEDDLVFASGAMRGDPVLGKQRAILERIVSMESRIDELETMLSSEVQDNVSLREDRHRLENRVAELERRETRDYDCRIVGRVAEFSGSHCPIGEPCQRCQLERAERRVEELERTIEASPYLDAILCAREVGVLRTRVAELEGSVRTMHQDCSELTVERNRYREALEKIADLIPDTNSLGEATEIAIEALNNK